MDFFKSQLDRIQKQLSTLTPSQKMLTAAMVAIMVMTLVWWGRYAGEPEMESLLPQAVSAEELPRIELALDGNGIKHVMSGDKILVPADQKLRGLASLSYAHVLPRAAKDGLDEVLKNINPFMSQSQTDKMWNLSKQSMIGQMISDFPDVADARVVMDPTRETHVGGNVESSATVTITMRSGVKAPQKLVDAAADLVQGALSSLNRNRIKVIVDGMAQRVRSEAADGGMIGDDQQEMIAHEEARLEAKLKQTFGDIDGLLATVTVTLNTTREHETRTEYDPKTSVQKATESQSKTTENTGAASAGGEPGVQTNAGLSLNTGPAAAPAPAGPTNSTEETTDKFENKIGERQIDRTTPAGTTVATSAAMRVPMAYFVARFKNDNPGVKDPTEKQLAPHMEKELAAMREQVKKSIGLKLDTDVAINPYIDPSPMAAGPQTVTAGVSSALLTGGHIREAVLGVLALVSLFMVSMMVKKGSPAPAVAMNTMNNAPTGPAPVIDVSGEVVGEVGSGVSTLDGMELDDDALRTQQMLEQVSSLVKENPDSAATLVKRWLNRA